MKWSEVIMVRSTGGSASALGSAVMELMEDVARHKGNETIQAFRRESIDTDYCIVLFHEAKTAEKGGSRLGLRIAAALKEFGMVHHTVWIEMGPES